MTEVPRRRQFQPRARANGLLGSQMQPAGIYTTPKSTTLGLQAYVLTNSRPGFAQFCFPYSDSENLRYYDKNSAKSLSVLPVIVVAT